MKQDTQGLIPYNKPQDTKLLAYNETKLLEYKETLHALQKLDKSFKDFMSMPFSIIVDSKGNALPLTSQAIKNFIFHNLYKEFMSATKALNKPLAQLDFKPLSNEIKALPYKANANLKAHLRDINAKTNELLDSMQEFKNTTKEIKLLAYNKPSENNAVEVDRLSNVLGEIPKTREYQVITDKKAFIENLNVLKSVAEPIPPTLDIHAFLKTLDNVENKENFIEHLLTRNNAETRLAYLNLVEPTLKRADIELTFLPNKKEYIKSFKDKDNNLLYLLVTKNNDKTLITGIPNANERYVKNEINKADIIHSFVPLNRQTTEVVNGLQQNPTTKQEISKEIPQDSKQQLEANLKGLYEKLKGLNKYNKIEGYKYRDILDNQIKPAIAKHFKPILDKLKTAENKKQMQQIIMQNREGLSDYLAFNIAKAEHKDIDGYLTGDIDFYDKDVVKFFKHREDKQASKIYDDIRYRVLASIENLQDKNTSIHLFFDDLEGNSGHYKTYPRKKDLALDNVTIGSHFKEAMLISSKDTNLKEKIIEKLKDEYLDTELYKDYLEFCINSMKRYEPEKSKSNSVTQKTELTFGGGIHKEWNPQKLKAWEKELENVSQKIKDTQEVEKGISALKGETSLESATQKADSNDIIFTDKKGKEHTLTKEVQEQWLKTFNLKSLDESYIPKHSDEIREALGGKEIKLQLGSLKKLVAQGREQYIPQIKEVLDSPEAILKDSDNAFLFAKHLKE